MNLSQLEDMLNVLSRQNWEILYPFYEEKTELGREFIVIAKKIVGPNDIIESEAFEHSRRLEQMESEVIEEALKEFKWNKTKVSKVLGIMKQTLYRKIKKYGLERGE